MNLPELENYEDAAIETVVGVINAAKNRLGEYTTLHHLIQTRKELTTTAILPYTELYEPAISYGEFLIRDAIEKKWRLTTELMYTLKNLESKTDYVANYFYYEAIFSQPTNKYPIPQATVSVIFTLQIKRLGPAVKPEVPKMTYRLEGHHTEHDIRFVKLAPEWILGVLQMKLMFFQRIESMYLF